ncbi:sialate O-acetylesterase [Clostridium bowmanii]|uniref:sialate O-acetylesterase n=1 Tax=Clostridium bowmanii TaxID=132925 RepID=UPI001C0E0AA8|nr:sialate O-acetylesterase [Clostridium bowmanii]MBU3191004.1 sialate O-acetylesterase [Clostridium bowmanii]MCA1075326.1 sialate O-acetylesterase [Clostridium bowmanii]
MGKEKVLLDLYLLIGQSNMAGRGELNNEDKTPNSRILKLDENNSWVEAVEPVHFDKPDIVGVGPSLTFANEILKDDSSSIIGLIPCAVGGTKLERWIKGGDLYENAIKRALDAMENGEIKAILWLLGESDSALEEDALNYKDRLLQTIIDLRIDLKDENIPFIAGKIGDFLNTNQYPYVNTINSAIIDLKDKINNYDYVETAGFNHIGDFLHFNAYAAKELGKRYAIKYIEMTHEK